ncbi:thermonuclease family protein [Oryzibacter oryziterrae]|uniref:thermonuclease family protein n=1 Tax=Oryzibacter oryziterrae TaxID=2766474 RepID=UPI001F322760|nr:thermonuclease family protein [Oryzibacter oryziterrae]
MSARGNWMHFRLRQAAVRSILVLLLTTPTTPGSAAEAPPACGAGVSLTGRIAGIEVGVGSAVPVLRLSPKMGPLPAGLRLSGLIFPSVAGDADRALLQREGTRLTGLEVTVEIPPGSRFDRHGRLPGMVRLPTGETLQHHLLAAGAALASGENATCWNDFVEAETDARRERHGIWNHSALITAVRETERLQLPDFVLLRGRVASVGKAGRSVYLNLGTDRLSAPTVRLTGKAVDALAARGVDADSFVGHQIEARGWATARRGLLLTLDGDALGLVEVDGK